MLNASYEVNEDESALEFKIEGASSEDFCTILGGFRTTLREYETHFYDEFLKGRSDMVAGRSTESEIEGYLAHLYDVIHRLERIYRLSVEAEERLAVEA